MGRNYLVFITFLLFACSDPAGQAELSRFQATLDSVRPDSLIAAYAQENGFSFIYKNNNERRILKLTRVKSFPLNQDTLTQVADHAFRSKKYPYVFVINDSSVCEVFLRKIIHPSSNWQGQTPGQDSIMMRYRRIDGLRR